MEPALYALIGALGGIAITNISNYFLEDRKSKNQINLKKLELESLRNSDLINNKRTVYSKYLEATDRFYSRDIEKFETLISHFYEVMILAEHETRPLVVALFNITKQRAMDKEFDISKFKKVKKELLEAMHNEFQDQI